jgi:winged helix DNA-binding protein
MADKLENVARNNSPMSAPRPALQPPYPAAVDVRPYPARVPHVLTARALNRALLARQGLLERQNTPALATLERLVGMQAQVPENPYVALHARLTDFDPHKLSAAIETGEAVRAQLMRATIHLVTRRDLAAIAPVTGDVLARTFKTQFSRRLEGVTGEEAAAAGQALLATGPRTRAELATELATRWPDADPAVLAQAVTYLSPLIQVPPRGLWGGRGQARWALAPTRAATPDLDDLVVRYLEAFGPATTADIRTWSGLTGLRAVVDRLRPDLRTFADERGAELLDVPGAPLPDPVTPAPPRFLPEYDNVSLSHADRARILGGRGPGLPFPRGSWIGTLLVDGFYRANWRYDDGTLTIDRFTPASDDPPGTRPALEAEGERLIGLVAPGTHNRNVEFVG